MHDPSPDLYDAKLKKINGVSAQRTQQIEIYFINWFIYLFIYLFIKIIYTR